MTHCQTAQIAKFMGPTWGPPGSCRPQMDPMLAPSTLLSGGIWAMVVYYDWGTWLEGSVYQFNAVLPIFWTNIYWKPKNGYDFNFVITILPCNIWHLGAICLIFTVSCRIQSGAIIMWSDIVRYFINDCRNWGRISEAAHLTSFVTIGCC